MERIAIVSAVAAQLALVWACADIFCRIAFNVNGLTEAVTLVQAHGQDWMQQGQACVGRVLAALITHS